MNDSDFRGILGQKIVQTRRRKFRTVDKARVAAGIARGTWEKAERGDPIKDFSMAAIEEALGWEPGYAAAILNGHDPGYRGLVSAGNDARRPEPPARRSGLDRYLEEMEDRLDELEARMARAEQQLSDLPSTTGLAIAAHEEEGSIAGEQESEETP